MPRVEVAFPLQGVNKNWANSEQPPLSSPDCNNVRPIDVSETRIRGGQRPGLDKWGAGDQLGSAFNPVVAMTIVYTTVT
jgi:hypothetical protein